MTDETDGPDEAKPSGDRGEGSKSAEREQPGPQFNPDAGEENTSGWFDAAGGGRSDELADVFDGKHKLNALRGLDDGMPDLDRSDQRKDWVDPATDLDPDDDGWGAGTLAVDVTLPDGSRYTESDAGGSIGGVRVQVDDGEEKPAPWWKTPKGVTGVVAVSLAGLVAIVLIASGVLGGSNGDTVADDASGVIVEDDDAASEVPAQEEAAQPVEAGSNETDEAPPDEDPVDEAPVNDDSADSANDVVPVVDEASGSGDDVVAGGAADETPVDECAGGTNVEGATAGLDPHLTLAGYQLFVDLPTTELYVLLCFSQPWTFGPPVDLWSFAHTTVIELLSNGVQGFAAPPEASFAGVLYELHDGVWTVKTETSDGPTATTIMLTAGGNSLVRTALTVEPGFEGRLLIQTASTPSATDEVARFATDATITENTAVVGNVAELVEVVEVDSDLFPGFDPDGFGPLTVGPPT